MKNFYLILKYGAILLWSSFVVLPFLWALTTSFKTANGVTGGATYIPWLQYKPSLEGWKVLVRTGGQGIDIVVPYINSMVVTGCASLISLALGTLAAYGLSRFTYKLGFVKNTDITFFFISQRIMPPIVLSIPFFLMLQFFSLLDTLVGLIIVYIALLLPIATWIMVDFFNNVPQADRRNGHAGRLPSHRNVFPGDSAQFPARNRRGRPFLPDLRLERFFLCLHADLHQNPTAAGGGGGPQLLGYALVESVGLGPGFGCAPGDHRFHCRAFPFERKYGRRDPIGVVHVFTVGKY